MGAGGGGPGCVYDSELQPGMPGSGGGSGSGTTGGSGGGIVSIVSSTLVINGHVSAQGELCCASGGLGLSC